MTRRADVEAGAALPAARLKKRADFLRAAAGRKIHAALFTVQSVKRPEAEGPQARVGFTVTKKVGNAVERNRIRRRLREVVRLTPDLGINPSHDYVIVARRTVLDTPFAALASNLRGTLGRVDRPRSGGSGRDRRSDVPRGETRS